MGLVVRWLSPESQSTPFALREASQWVLHPECYQEEAFLEAASMISRAVAAAANNNTNAWGQWACTSWFHTAVLPALSPPCRPRFHLRDSLSQRGPHGTLAAVGLRHTATAELPGLWNR